MDSKSTANRGYRNPFYIYNFFLYPATNEATASDISICGLHVFMSVFSYIIIGDPKRKHVSTWAYLQIKRKVRDDHFYSYHPMVFVVWVWRGLM